MNTAVNRGTFFNPWIRLVGNLQGRVQRNARTFPRRFPWTFRSLSLESTKILREFFVSYQHRRERTDFRISRVFRRFLRLPTDKLAVYFQRPKIETNDEAKITDSVERSRGIPGKHPGEKSVPRIHLVAMRNTGNRSTHFEPRICETLNIKVAPDPVSVRVDVSSVAVSRAMQISPFHKTRTRWKFCRRRQRADRALRARHNENNMPVLTFNFVPGLWPR